MSNSYKIPYLKSTGEVAVEPVSGNLSLDDHLILVVGPTGAGKSSLIEAFAGKSQTLSISKDQLAGYTQDVSAYRLVNVKGHGRSVYLIDTPGFADTNISECEILDMIRKWLNTNGRTVVNCILYLIPINAPRLAGSKRRTIDMLKTLLQQPQGHPQTKPFDSIIFITTMWDTLPNERAQERAEKNFVQLKDEILKELIEGGAEIRRFSNTKASALHCFDVNCWSSDAFFQSPIASSPHHRNLYQDLHSRIENALATKKIIENDLAQPDVEMYPELKAILERNYAENQQTLKKFVVQLIRFGDAPSKLGDAFKGLRKQIVAYSDIDRGDEAYAELLDIWANDGRIPHTAYPNEDGVFSDEARTELKRQHDFYTLTYGYRSPS